MPVGYTNNARSTLAYEATQTATTLGLAAGTGSRFPSVPTSDFWFYATISNAEETLHEIVKVTSNNYDFFGVVRAQDVTTARVWPVGSKVELRLNKAMIDDLKTDTRAAISFSNVTTALGFTPYSNTNPSGFISGISSAQVTTALGYTPSASVNLQEFSTVGTSTWTKPSGARMVHVLMYGGGGGGSGGQSNVSPSTTGLGGKGGNAGGRVEAWFPASALNATETVLVGAGGAGGAANANGSGGGTSSFVNRTETSPFWSGYYLNAFGGTAASNPQGGAGDIQWYARDASNNVLTATGAGGLNFNWGQVGGFGPGGGGSGAWSATGGSLSVPGEGGRGGAGPRGMTTLQGGGGAGGNPGQAGRLGYFLGGDGGSGGYGGGPGAVGGFPGGGGGGGGVGVTVAGGAGGAGGGGFVRITTYF